MLFSEVKLQIKRNIGRSILTLCISLSVILLGGVYWENIVNTEQSLQKLSDSIPVTGTLTDISGKKQTALEIPTSTVDRILKSGYVKNAVYIGQAAGNLEVYNQIENPKVFDTTIIGSNSYAAFSSLTKDKVQFSEKGDVDFLSSDKSLCVISEQYAKEHNVNMEDILEFPLYSIEYKQESNSIQYHKVGTAKLTVIGYVSEQYFGSSSANVLVPIQWLRSFIENADIPFSYISMTFQVKEPMELNAFKKEMEKIGLREKNSEAIEEICGDTLILDDTIFIENADRLQTILWILEKFQGPFYLLIGILMITVDFLIMRSRRLEIAIATSLGQKKSTVATQLFLEIGLLTLSGIVLGVMILLLFSQIPIKVLLRLSLLLILEGSIGAIIALKALFQFDVMAMLTKID